MELDLAALAPHVGSAFAVDGRPARIVLVEVTPLRAQPGAPRTEPFSLVFAGDRAEALAQGLCRLSHPDLGEAEIFLVPIGPGADGRLLYEAVFN